MSERDVGRVKWFDAEKGYGFIHSDEHSEDVFVHESDVPGSNLDADEKLLFSVEQTSKGLKAVDVEIPGAGLPLYCGADPAASLDSSSNCGLVYDKYCDTWHDVFDGFEEPGNDEDWDARGKWKWIGKFDGHRPGDEARIRDFVRRRRNLVSARGGRTFTFETTSRFVTGLGQNHPVENGFAWHHTLGTPYLAGSGVKGTLKAWAAEWLEADSTVVADVFGDNTDTDRGVGEMVFFDAVPSEPPELAADVMTPHYDEWYQKGPESGAVPADWHSPTPIPFLVVEEGATFQFAIAPRTRSAGGEHLDRVEQWLRDALEWIGAGAKTSVGYGRFEPVQ